MPNAAAATAVAIEDAAMEAVAVVTTAAVAAVTQRTSARNLRDTIASTAYISAGGLMAT